MLFPYTYVPHQMEKMQKFIDFIFFEVWCKAPPNIPFGLDLFDAEPELREVMEAFFYSDAQGADFFSRARGADLRALFRVDAAAD
jgi:hypothetical protein